MALAVLLAGPLAASCSSTAGPSRPAASPRSRPPSPTPSPSPPSASRGLTPAQLVGQHLVYSYPGDTPPQALLQRIRAGEVAGVIFFKENVASAAGLRSAVDQLRRAQQASPVHRPLLLMTDQEGGQVRRVPGAPASSARMIGATGSTAAAAAAGRDAGRNLRSLGLTVNLAPVLDVYRSPGDLTDQAQRSFSQDPAAVGAMGTAFAVAQQAAGVASTAKHFPGLGAAAAAENTDLRPVTLDLPLAQLRERDEAPYRQAITAGVKLVMLSWARYPALDAAHPAGLSPTVVRTELRGRLGFTGVTITDALEAKALDPVGPTGTRAVAAAGAGMDLLLCSARAVGQGDAAAQALGAALRDHRLDPAAFRASADRILALRATLAG